MIRPKSPKSRLPQRRLRSPFRMVAWVVGPILIGAGALMVVLDLLGRQAHGLPAWTHSIHAGLWLGLGNLVLGYVILRAARTGRDPYTERERDPDAGAQ